MRFLIATSARARPAAEPAGLLAALSALLVFLIASLPAEAADDYFNPRAVTPPPATGEVPEPEGYRTDGYRMPVPKTLAGAKVIGPDEAEKIMKEAGAVFIDVYPRAPKPPNLPAGTVWRDPPHATIPGAHWLPNVGYGVLSPDFENYFKSRLKTLTSNDMSKPILFFCLKDCWMSWNAAKRALSWGYKSVLWFPEGTDGWQSLGNDLTSATAIP